MTTRELIIQTAASVFIRASLALIVTLAAWFRHLDKPQPQPKEEPMQSEVPPAYDLCKDAALIVEQYLQQLGVNL